MKEPLRNCRFFEFLEGLKFFNSIFPPKINVHDSLILNFQKIKNWGLLTTSNTHTTLVNLTYT
jgi:hypothetical protein